MTQKTASALLLAGGNGSRMGTEIEDKVLFPLNGKSCISYSIHTFTQLDAIKELIFVVRDAVQQKAIEVLLSEFSMTIPALFCSGGKERSDSVYNGLQIANQEIVFIHDCARPNIQKDSLQELYKATCSHQAAVLCHRVVDTIKQVSGENPGVLKDLNRSSLRAMETPQVFITSLIRQAYELIKNKNLTVTDDTAAISELGVHTYLVENPYPNPKLTYSQDIPYIESLLQQKT